MYLLLVISYDTAVKLELLLSVLIICRILYKSTVKSRKRLNSEVQVFYFIFS